jgi:hypothetical protein
MIEYTVKQKDFSSSKDGEKYRFMVSSKSPEYSCDFLIVDAATWAAFKVGDKINITVSAAPVTA